jgi:hypothetical protein
MLCPHFGGIQDVIKVLVGQKQSIHFHAEVFEPFRHALRRIHEDRPSRKAQKMAVCGGDAAGEGLDGDIRHGPRNAGNRWTIQDGKYKVPRKTEPAAR